MKSVLMKRATVLIVGFLMILSLLLPPSGNAQGRGRGRGLSKKSVKFVNGHDARDGRWDGRGPRRRLVRGRWVYLRERQHRGWIRLKHRRSVR
jgi:hypothetical protein